MSKAETTDDDLLKKVCFELCQSQGRNPLGGCISNVQDLQPLPHLAGRVQENGTFEWIRWEGYVPDAQRLINLIQKGSVYG